MSSSRFYVLDANVFIDAKNRYYHFDLCPGFWEALLDLHDSDRLISIDKVGGEVKGFGDRLSSWVEDEAPEGYFATTQSEEVVASYTELISWVSSHSDFRQSAIQEYADSADSWLLAYAHAGGHTIVTLEAHKPNAKSRVPIPNVCEQFGIPYVNTFEMLQNLGVSFTCS